MTNNTTLTDAVNTSNQWTYIRTIQAIFLSLFFITGIPGNSVICLLVYRSPRLRTVTMVTNMIVGNLAVADLAVCVLKISVSLATIAKGKWVGNQVICNAVGFGNSLLLFEVLYSLALVSVSRYCCVLLPSKFSAIFTRKRTYAIIAATWIISTVFASPPLLGWASFHFEFSKATCVVNIKNNLSYTIIYLTLLQFAVPFLLITVPYYKIFKFLRVHNRRLSTKITTSSFRQQNTTSIFHDFKMTKLLLIVVCFFVACWAPYTIVNLLASFSAIPYIPIELDSICHLLTLLSSSCNPFIYGSLNNQFRKGFRDILCGTCHKNQLMKRQCICFGLRSKSSQYSFNRNSFKTRRSRKSVKHADRKSGRFFMSDNLVYETSV